MAWFKNPLSGKKGISKFLQSSFNIALMRHLPKFMSRSYVSSLGSMFFDFNPTLTRRINTHLAAALQADPMDPYTRTLDLTLSGILAHYYEKLFVAFYNFKKVCRFLSRRVTVTGEEQLRQALDRGKGALVVTGHYGAVEFLPLTLALKGYPVTMLLRFKTQKLKDSLIKRTQTEGIDIELVDVAEDKKVVFTALKALKSNRILITECDEFDCWSHDKRKKVDFLGHKLAMDRSLNMLQKRSKAPVVMGLVKREDGDRYRLDLQALDIEKSKEEKSSIAQQALNVLETYIMAAPHQWYQWKEADFLAPAAATQPPRPQHEVPSSRYLPAADPVPAAVPA